MTTVQTAPVRSRTRHALIVFALIAVSLVAFLPGIASLPPTDRDESRYVQATKQMVETGDYVDIRLQEVSRYKKPIGIYWLQAAFVGASGEGAEAPIWIYRLVSTTGAVLAVLGMYWTGAFLFGPPAGLLAAIGMIGMFATNFEARIAKTDAMLLATAVAAQAALLHAYVSHKRGTPIEGAKSYLFWLAQAAAILVKGPIVPLLSGLTALGVAYFDRDRRWIATLRPGRGISLTVLIVLPWLLLISWKTGLEFWHESVGNDLLGKVMEGQESHGFPPGYYALSYGLFMWPFTVLALQGGLRALNRFREDPCLLVLLCWYIPFWLFFELLPTKLPHYVLPAYPAIILMMAWFYSDALAETIELRRWQRLLLWLARIGTVVVTVGLAAVAAGAEYYLFGRVSPVGIVAALVILAAGALGLAPIPRTQAPWRLAATAAAGALSFAMLATYVVPSMTPFWLSPRIAETFHRVKPCATSRLSSADYHEPSLVFLTETGTRLVRGAQAAADLMADRECAVAVVTRRQMASFVDALPQGLASVTELARIDGINYSKGDRLELVFYRAAD